jgi:hypothetical protein
MVYTFLLLEIVWGIQVLFAVALKFVEMSALQLGKVKRQAEIN